MFWLRIVLAGLVSALWAVGYILAYIGKQPNAPTELSGLMAIVLGWALGGTLRDVFRRRNGEDDDAPKA